MVSKPTPAKATLFWGIIHNDAAMGRRPEFEVFRVTSQSERQIGGIRDGDLGGTVFSRRNLVGSHGTKADARAAIAVAEEVRKQHHIPIRDAENALRRMRDAERTAKFGTL